VDRSVSDAAPVVECRNVTLALGGRTVLNDVSLAIAAGEFVGVLGPNGAGKTTLLRAILGLVPPARGQIAVLGEPAARGNAAIGYMPQTRVAPAGLRITGHDFVAAVVRGHRPGLPHLDAAARREVAWALEMVEATALARRPLGDMSGGERQRLLLAQALVGHPRLLLLDEPLISLDPTRQLGVVALVRRVQRELGIAVLFSAHEINPLLGALDRVLYLGGGHAAIGHVDEVITGDVLSRLYGTAIDVVRLGGRIFVLAGPHDMEGDAHRHDDEPAAAHGHHTHGHDAQGEHVH
jgi:zinc/manganese transport system ATP-binding protein